jgi:hypothetical protein
MAGIPVTWHRIDAEGRDRRPDTEPSPKHLVPGTRDPVPDQRRGPNTEHRGPNRGIGRFEMWKGRRGAGYQVPDTQ